MDYHETVARISHKIHLDAKYDATYLIKNMLEQKAPEKHSSIVSKNKFPYLFCS